ncbi:hypothetical protein PGTUg99_029339 [Puccinia graminis f. sp. tritici]|uniref:Uncharacterized protein n=1 Tax=Puccinia graminis f. sp. tritici TaxID=56615 RepID=A0A5B0RP71_PUCGR|nr:hypothetical protein PGTUg99_029339 [Puccinia graminis f. sp. tritici]
MIPPPLNPLPLQIFSLWWNDDRIPPVRFVEYFRMSLADFRWLSDELRPQLQQDPLGRGEPLSVEAQGRRGRLDPEASSRSLKNLKRFSYSKQCCLLNEEVYGVLWAHFAISFY